MRTIPVDFARDFPVWQNRPHWFNASAIEVLLPPSSLPEQKNGNRAERRAATKGAR